MFRSSRFLVTVLVVIALGRCGPGSTDSWGQSETSSRRDVSGNVDDGTDSDAATLPNIILISLDDADVDLFTDEILDTYLPNIKRLATEGMRFTNCHVVTPVCGPSRTCLLRGQHAHRTGIKSNVAAGWMNNGFSGAYQLFKQLGYEEENLAVWMHRAGYRTMMVGKYHHGGMDAEGLPGWDDLYMCFGGNYYETARYAKRLPKEQRRRATGKTQYRTVVEAEEAVWMIEQQVKRNRELNSDAVPQPFFLYVAPLAPHKPAAQGAMLQQEYKDLGKEIRLAETPDLNEADVSDKPSHLQVAKFTEAKMAEMHEEHRKRVISLKSVDDLVGRILETIKTANIEDLTYIFFTSDHGYQLGHNRMFAKQLPYHRNTVVPMYVVGPNVPVGTSDHLLAHIDLVPTFLELAGGTATVTLDGKSWVPILSNPDAVSPDEFRKSLLIQNWMVKSQYGDRISAAYASLRMPRQIYTEWSNGEREYYDLNKDPYQVENAIGSLSAEQKAQYSRELHRLKRGDTKPIATVASPELISRNATLRGLAEDDDAVAKVEISVHDSKQNAYWTGKDWGSEYRSVITKLSNENGLITDWHCSVDLSKIENDGQVTIVAMAKDNQGNVSEPTSFTFRVDAIEPETLLKLPARDTTIESPVMLFGFCNDNQELRGIELVLQNVDKKTFWNGSEWTTTESTFFKRVAQERWHTIVDVTSGRYRASARAVDQAGNYDSTPSVTEFNVK